MADTLEREHSQTQLDKYTSEATLQYSNRKYEEAAELYAHATELQARLNGEMSTRNADLLYLYGRCLYQVAVKKSDVLGSKVAGERQDEEPSIESSMKEDGATAVERHPGAVATISELSQSEQNIASKPYFQFTGDENFDTSDEEDDDADLDARPEDGGNEEDDFADAFEVLDMARVLILQSIEEEEVHAPATDTQDASRNSIRSLRERLADIHDLQAEISLEGERFGDAVLDLRSALELKSSLYPFESNLLAEAHYKLSLALEFSSVSLPRNQDGEIEEGKVPVVDEKGRAEAVKEMEFAIASCKGRIDVEERRQHHMTEDTGKLGSKAALDAIEDVKEMVMDMEQRLLELRRPPTSIQNPSSPDELNPMSGIMRAIAQAPSQQKHSTLEQAIETATDLTALVKKRKPIAKDEIQQGDPKATELNGKRKHENEALPSEKRSRT